MGVGSRSPGRGRGTATTSASLAISAVFLGQQLAAASRYHSCSDLLLKGFTTSGAYTIYPGGGSTAVTAYCDQTTDGGGWRLVWKHAQLEVGTVNDNMRFFSTYDKPCTNLEAGSDGWCNVPSKLSLNPTQQMIVAYHNGVSVYAYKGDINPDLDTSWHGAILNNYVRIQDDCTGCIGCPPEPEGPNGAGSHIYAGLTFDKWNPGEYTSNCDTNSNGNGECRWHNCHSGGGGFGYSTQMTLAMFVRDAPLLPPLEADSCADLLQQGATTSGTYSIFPRGSSTAATAYCDQTTDGGGWRLVWKHAQLEVGTVNDNMRFFSTYDKPCTNLAAGSDGWCNVPSKLSLNPTQQMIVAYHYGKAIYTYKGDVNTLLDTSWEGGILNNYVRIQDDCTSCIGCPPEPEGPNGAGSHIYAGLTFDKWNPGEYTSNCDTNSNGNGECRWHNCHSGGGGFGYSTQMTLAMFVKDSRSTLVPTGAPTVAPSLDPTMMRVTRVSSGSVESPLVRTEALYAEDIFLNGASLAATLAEAQRRSLLAGANGGNAASAEAVEAAAAGAVAGSAEGGTTGLTAGLTARIAAEVAAQVAAALRGERDAVADLLRRVEGENLRLAQEVAAAREACSEAKRAAATSQVVPGQPGNQDQGITPSPVLGIF